MTGSAVAPAVATCWAGASSSSSSERVNDSPPRPRGARSAPPRAGPRRACPRRPRRWRRRGRRPSRPWRPCRPWRRPSWSWSWPARRPSSRRRPGWPPWPTRRRPSWPARSWRPAWPSASRGLAAGLLAAAFAAGFAAFLAGADFLAGAPHLGGGGLLRRGRRRDGLASAPGGRGNLGLDHDGHSFLVQAAQHGLHPARRDAGGVEGGPDVTRGDVPAGPSLVEQPLHLRAGELRGKGADRVRHVLPLLARLGVQHPALACLGGRAPVTTARRNTSL